MKTKRIAYLDDDVLQLNVFKAQIDAYNKKSNGVQIELECFQRPKDFEREFDHDYAVIDIDLRRSDVNGFDMANFVMKKYNRPVILTSCNIPPEEVLDSFMPKVKFKISDLLPRLERLKKNHTKNVLQICSREGTYCVAG